MSYGKTTNFFKLPYMESGDILNEADEARRANIIDGLLYVATFGSTNAIITDALYSLEMPSESNCSLVISSSNTVSIMPTVYATFTAIINGYLAYRTDTITVSNLLQGSVWKIYAVCNDSMLIDPNQVSVVASTNDFSNSNYLLLATVDFTGSTPTLDYTSGKMLYANMSQHSLVSSNPHGTDLTQSRLNVLNEMKIASYKIYPYVIMTIELDGDNDLELQFSTIGLEAQFVTVMGDSSGIGITIGTSSVVFSSNSARSIKVKIEGDPIA